MVVWLDVKGHVFSAFAFLLVLLLLLVNGLLNDVLQLRHLALLTVLENVVHDGVLQLDDLALHSECVLTLELLPLLALFLWECHVRFAGHVVDGYEVFGAFLDGRQSSQEVAVELEVLLDDVEEVENRDLVAGHLGLASCRHVEGALEQEHPGVDATGVGQVVDLHLGAVHDAGNFHEALCNDVQFVCLLALLEDGLGLLVVDLLEAEGELCEHLFASKLGSNCPLSAWVFWIFFLSVFKILNAAHCLNQEEALVVDIVLKNVFFHHIPVLWEGFKKLPDVALNEDA